MNEVNIRDIVIPEERQRRDFSPTQMWELETSIEKKGLMHPPVVRNDGVTLVAGERRYRTLVEMHKAGKDIWYDGKVLEAHMIPITKLGDLNEVDLYEAELEENTLRVDLTWQEKARAVERLHKFRLAHSNDKQTFTDTAEEILGRKPHGGEAATLVRNSIILADHLDSPEVAGAKTEKEAFKIVEKRLKKAHRAKLSEEFKTVESKHTLIKGDSLIEMGGFTEEFDCIITDPPYGMGADTFGTMALNDHNYDDSKDWFINNIGEIAREFYSIAKAEAHCYIFCDIQNYTLLCDKLSQAGWDVWRTPLVWYKGNIGMLPRPDHGPRRTYELCVYAIKGKKKTQLVGAHDVINIINEQGDKDHAAQKPPTLYRELIRRSCLPGDKIIDPFCGSGPIFTAADDTETIATGIELGEDAYAQAVARLQK